MAQRTAKNFSVDTSPTKDVVVDGLTRDATVEACIFDLIDNSVDAARDTASKPSREEVSEVLLNDYTGFRIELTISGDGLSISDNCGGIPVDALRCPLNLLG